MGARADGTRRLASPSPMSGEDAERVVDDGSRAIEQNFKARVFRIAESVARDNGRVVTPKAMHAIGELSLAFSKSCARDALAYARHASRDVVTRADVDLRARRVRDAVERADGRAREEDADDGANDES